MATGPLFAVVTPALRRAPSGPTLIKSANLVTDTGRWIEGLRYVPDACGIQASALTAGDCTTPFAGFPDGPDFPLGDPVEFVPVYVAVAAFCSTIGGQQVIADTEERARRLLDLSDTVGIARELWRGDQARAATPDLPNDYLGKTSTLTDLGDFSVLDALAALEYNLGVCSVAGGNMIHASTRLATYWSHLNVVERRPDGTLVTKLGTIVVADPGYDGSGPNGADPDADGSSSWAYGTGPVDIRRGPVEVIVDTAGVRTQNDLTVYAYRAVAATFDPCCHLAVEVDHTTLT